MFAIMLPHLLSVKNMSALSVLRRDLYTNSKRTWFNYLPVFIVLIGLMLWQAHDVKIALASIVGLILICVIAGFLAFVIAKARPQNLAHSGANSAELDSARQIELLFDCVSADESSSAKTIAKPSSWCLLQ